MEQEHLNVLKSITIRADEIEIKSLFREYHLDTSAIEEAEKKNMVHLLKKQNYDNRFRSRWPNKTLKFVPALRASTGPKKAAPF